MDKELNIWIHNQVSMHLSDLRSSYAFVGQPITREILRDFLCDQFWNEFVDYPTDSQRSQIFESTQRFV